MGLRQEKVADRIRDVIGKSLQAGRINDPRLQGVVVTHVKVSSDLQVATVYYRFFEGGLDLEEVSSALVSASGFFRRVLAGGLDLRRVPSLRFFFDKSIEKGSRIELLLSQI